MTTKQQVVKTTERPTAEAENTASPDAREAPVIKSTALTWQHEGHNWREAFVRLPADLVLQDLQDVPTVWKNIQASRHTALQRFDRVSAVSFDETWMIKDVVVVEAGVDRVTLAIRPNDRISLPTKTGAVWENSEYQIRWAGSGYGAFRKQDGVPVMPAHYASVDLAKSELYRQVYNRTTP